MRQMYQGTFLGGMSNLWQILMKMYLMNLRYFFDICEIVTGSGKRIVEREIENIENDLKYNQPG